MAVTTQANLTAAMEHLARAAESVGITPPAGMRWTLEHGNKSVHVAFIVSWLGPQGAREITPLFSGGVVGYTKSEAYDYITRTTYTLDAVARAIRSI
jgi:hypothetical protein